MQIVSACCHRPIEPKHDREYPLGGLYGIATVVEACTGCGEEHPETLETCDNCGDVAEMVIETRLGGFCQPCVNKTVEELTEMARTQGLKVVMGL